MNGGARLAFSDDPQPEKLPGVFKQFVAKYPQLGDGHQQIGKAVQSYGLLDRKTLELIKIGMSIGAGLETATRSHVRQALQHGATVAEIEQAVLSSMRSPSSGFVLRIAIWTASGTRISAISVAPAMLMF